MVDIRNTKIQIRDKDNENWDGGGIMSKDNKSESQKDLNR